MQRDILKTFLIFILLIPYNLFTSGAVSTSITEIADSLKYPEKIRFMGEYAWSLRERNPDKAIKVANYAIYLADSMKLYSQSARINNFAGAIYLHYKYELKKSLSYLNNALEKAIIADDSIQIGYAFNNLGDAFQLSGNIPLAMEYAKKSLYIFKAANDSAGIGYSYINLAFAYQKDGNFDSSLFYFKKTLQIRRSNRDTLGIASSYQEIGSMYFAKNEIEKAKAYFTMSYNLHKKLDNRRYIAQSLKGLADVNLYEGNFSQVKEFYLKALELFSERKDYYGMIDVRLGLANYYSKINQKEAGEAELFSALSIAKELGTSDKLFETYKAYTEFYLNINDFNEANKQFKNFLHLYDSLYSVQQYETLNEIQNRFEMDQNLYEAKLNLQSERKIRILLITLIVVLLVLGGILFWRFRENVKLNKELKLSNASRDKLFSIISHDIRSPFNAILGHLELLKDSNITVDPEKYQKIFKSLYLSSKNTYNLLENLLTWSQVQTGALQAKPEKLNLKILVTETIELFADSLNSKSININNKITDNLELLADKEMLRSIIRNLLSNAIKFSYKLGNIEIGTKDISKDKMVVIYVSDQGKGMKTDDISSLFDIGTEFTTPGTEKEKGTGLGMVLVQEFVHQHQGKVWIESEVGKGTRVLFTVPAYQI